jgi:hypothetical protein
MKPLLMAILLVSPIAGVGHSQPATDEPLLFVADLRGRHVAPAAVETAASARATAVLVDDKFTVHGSFAGLSSALRDIEKKPDDPGIHLHRGAPGETSPYFQGLRVRLNADERSGIFYGRATLDAEHLKLLLSNRTYVDIHTVKHGPGEVRDQWRPLDPAAAARLRTVIEAREQAHGAQMASGSCHGP